MDFLEGYEDKNMELIVSREIAENLIDLDAISMNEEDTHFLGHKKIP